MKLSEYLKIISEDIISVSNFKDIEIDSITNDSRKITGDTVFVAIEGAKLDGHSFIGLAITAGAEVVVYQNEPDVFIESITYIKVKNTYFVYAVLSEVFFGFPARKMKIIGITGTNGKTTCAFLINYILNYTGRKSGLISTVQYSYGDEILPAIRTTPEAFELQRLFSEMSNADCKYVVMEVSSHSLAQYRLGSTKFAGVLFTNLSGDHLDYHGDMENYYSVKKRLFKELSTEGDLETIKVINMDDAYGCRLISSLQGEKIITYGENEKCNYKFLCKRSGMITALLADREKYIIETSLIGRFNAYNIAGSVALCSELGVSPDIAVDALKHFSSVPGRLEVFHSVNNARCYFDYAHTDDALRRALTALRELSPARLIVVFGCGGDRDKTKRPRMGNVAFELADVIIITDDNPRTEKSADIINDIKSGIPRTDNIKIISDRRAAINYAVGIADKDDIVLIAGKGHEDYQEIGAKRHPFDDREVLRTLNFER